MKTELANISKTGKRPVMKSKCGRFDVSVWHWIRFGRAQDDNRADRDIHVERACIRYSRWNRMTQGYDDVRIWCSVDELRCLVQALDGLNVVGESKTQEGANSPSPSPDPEHDSVCLTGGDAA